MAGSAILVVGESRTARMLVADGKVGLSRVRAYRLSPKTAVISRDAGVPLVTGLKYVSRTSGHILLPKICGSCSSGVLDYACARMPNMRTIFWLQPSYAMRIAVSTATRLVSTLTVPHPLSNSILMCNTQLVVCRLLILLIR